MINALRKKTPEIDAAPEPAPTLRPEEVGKRWAIEARGIKVPEDLSICGYDDTPLSRQLWPRLTTVRQPIYELGQTVAAALLRALNGSVGEEPQRPALSLVVRETTMRRA
mgnify:CR=1 FL=1